MIKTTNWNIIYAQTNDYCVIWTTNFLETITKMSECGWTLVEQIDDDNSVIYLTKGVVKEFNLKEESKSILECMQWEFHYESQIYIF